MVQTLETGDFLLQVTAIQLNAISTKRGDLFTPILKMSWSFIWLQTGLQRMLFLTHLLVLTSSLVAAFPPGLNKVAKMACGLVIIYVTRLCRVSRLCFSNVLTYKKKPWVKYQIQGNIPYFRPWLDHASISGVFCDARPTEIRQTKNEGEGVPNGKKDLCNQKKTDSGHREFYWWQHYLALLLNAKQRDMEKHEEVTWGMGLTSHWGYLSNLISMPYYHDHTILCFINFSG